MCALVYRVDVTELWPRHVVREGQRVGLFARSQLRQLEPMGEISRAAVPAAV